MGVTFPKTLQVNRMGKDKLKYIMTWLFNCNDLFLMYFYFLHSDLLQYHFFLFEAAWNSVAIMCKQGIWNEPAVTSPITGEELQKTSCHPAGADGGEGDGQPLLILQRN